MIHSVKFTCVLDTNIIYPIEIRDLLFWFAHYELYTPKWSVHIFDEWKEIMARKGVPEEEILKRIEKANKAFPIVTNNLKDFPAEILDIYGMAAKSADDFLTDIIDLNPDTAVEEAFRKLVMHRRNPDLDEYQVLDALRKNQLRATADYLHALL